MTRSVAMFTLGELHASLPGSCVQGELSTKIFRVGIDSQTNAQGGLFVAVRRGSYDGHAFADDALGAGYVAMIAERGRLPEGAVGLEVDDAQKALCELARAWRSRFELPLAAVVGSNGKTTVTQMVASILRSWRPGEVLSTEGNMNNEIGAPLTMLRLNRHHRAGVVEVGMNGPGEILPLARLLAPSVVVVNNAQREHQEFMGSVENVARENGSALVALHGQGVAVIPAGDAFCAQWRSLAGESRVITFGEGSAADVELSSMRWVGGRWGIRAQTPLGRLDFSLKAPGRHNAINSMAAAACAIGMGVSLGDIGAGLCQFEAVDGRCKSYAIPWRGRTVALVDDSYNANPDSALAAVETLAGMPSPRVFVFGDMAESGSLGPEVHAEVGERARALGIEKIWTLGELSRELGGRHFNSYEELCEQCVAELDCAGSIWVKGSRFMKMERLVLALRDAHPTLQSNDVARASKAPRTHP